MIVKAMSKQHATRSIQTGTKARMKEQNSTADRWYYEASLIPNSTSVWPYNVLIELAGEALTTTISPSYMLHSACVLSLKPLAEKQNEMVVLRNAELLQH